MLKNEEKWEIQFSGLSKELQGTERNWKELKGTARNCWPM